MVRRDLIGRKVARASAWLDQAEKTLLLAREQFLAIQECIDIAAHWLADEGWEAVDDAAGTFDVLAEHGVVAPDLADGMRRVVGLRNRIAHGYATVDHERLHRESPDGLMTLRKFLVAVVERAGI